MTTDQSTMNEPPAGADAVFFQLGIVMNLSISAMYRRFAKKHQLSLVDWQVLVLVASRAGIAPKELSDYLGVDKMTITRAVGRLLARGRIRSSTDATDRRRLALTATAKGRALYEAVLPHALAHQQDGLRELSAAEQLMLRELVAKLVSALRQMAAEEGAPRGRSRLARTP
jgi:DNA-binding MarR family transcriptional regulator